MTNITEREMEKRAAFAVKLKRIDNDHVSTWYAKDEADMEKVIARIEDHPDYEVVRLSNKLN